MPPTPKPDFEPKSLSQLNVDREILLHTMAANCREGDSCDLCCWLMMRPGADQAQWEDISRIAHGG